VFNREFLNKEIIMSNKGYAVLLVLAGMICGILLVSLTSSQAAAKLPTEERVIAKPVPTKVIPPVPPVVTFPNIHVYPVGTGGKDDDTAYAYIVKDGKLWLLEGTTGRQIHFLR